MDTAQNLTLTFWTRDPAFARAADVAGVDRIGLDLERIGKLERQGGVGRCWISGHTEADLPAIAAALRDAWLFVRTNPLHPGSAAEIERLLAAGVRTLMLPMFRTVAEAECFIDLVGGRAEVVLLVEHADAALRIDDIVRLGGIDEIYVGLNDLGLSLGIRNRFAILDLPLFHDVVDAAHRRSLRFGFGGLARPDDRSLPIGPDLVYAAYARFGASSGLLSQVFVRADDPTAMITDVPALRARVRHWYVASGSALDAAAAALRSALDATATARV